MSQTQDLWKRASVGECVGRVSSRSVSRWSGSPGCCGCRGVFWVGRIFSCFFFNFFFLRTHTACGKYEAASCLIYLSTRNEAKSRERRGRFLPMGKKASSYRGAYRVPLFSKSVCLSVRLPLCLSVSLSACLLSVCLSVCPSVCLSVCPCVCQCVYV